MRNFGDCEEIKSDLFIPISENNKKITFINEKRCKIRKIHIDGCVIKDNNMLKCDYLIIDNKNIEYYIELKGSDINHAIEQLEATITYINADEKDKNEKKLSFIILKKVHKEPRYTTKIQNIKTKFQNKYNSKLIVKETPAEYKLN
jgi:hypothetical protein